MKPVLICSSNADNIAIIRDCLCGSFFIESEQSPDNFLSRFKQKNYDYLFIDLSFLQKDLKTKDHKIILSTFWQIFPDTSIILLTQSQFIREAVEFVKKGATDYLALPLVKNDIRHVIQQAEEKLRLVSELNYLRESVWSEGNNYLFKTKSPNMQKLLSDLRSVSKTDSTVLITGETGTGKSILAKLVHQESKRKSRQFVSIHCGAIPDSLLESELFGHERGAFTGAVRRKLGKFEIADEGTILLDEIGTISPSMQIKLLEVLQEKMFYRIGGESATKVDVRIISATNSNLGELADNGQFRKDLFYRLNVFQLEVPPLRERKNDIESLIYYTLQRLNKTGMKNIREIHPEVLGTLKEYSWPGNIRELENLMERAYILESSDMLLPSSFPVKLFKEKLKKYIQPVDINLPLEQVRQNELDRIEQEYLSELLIRNKGKIKESALAAGVSGRQLNNLLRKHHLDKKQFKS